MLESDRALRYKYGIDLQAKERMAESQGRACAICHASCELVVDHDHENGLLRGLLCARCNLGLGLFLDSADLLEQARSYLETHRASSRVHDLPHIELVESSGTLNA